MKTDKVPNPLDWSPDDLQQWLDDYEGGRYKPLSKQLKGFSGRQVAAFSDYQWFQLRPEELGNSFRYTFMGMCAIFVAKEKNKADDPAIKKAKANQAATDCYQEMTCVPVRNSIVAPKTPPVPFPPLIAMPALWHILLMVAVVITAVLLITVGHMHYERVLVLISIPLVSVVFTYVHIWLALWMTFYPLTFVGIGQFGTTNMGILGWQGIIPNKGEKMARKSVQIMTTQLMDVKEVFSRIDPKRVAEELQPILYNMIKDIIESMAKKYNPSLWAVLPQRVKDEIIEKIKEESPEHIEDMMNEIKNNITEVFDLEDMVVTNLMKDKQLLLNMFITCGYAELALIRNSGAYMGGIFGTIQMIIICAGFDNRVVVFMVFGVLVGTLTNWLALKMIFEPVNPRKVCCFTLHGLFLQRQFEVAGEYGRMVAKDVLNSRNIIEAILRGPASDKLFEIVFNNVKKTVDGGVTVTEKFVALSIGKETYQSIKDDVCHMVVEKFPDGLWYIEDYTTDALDLEATLRDKMRALSYADFENLLHPVFQEDEWKLVLMGGALGLLIGTIQTYCLNYE